MDVNGDGRIDIVSGSYSHTEPGIDMAGYFQVLLGEPGGKWSAAQVLRGNDGEPLLLPSTKADQADPNADVARICTRAFVADLDDDGNLDLVSGNSGGAFCWFRGEDAGGFAPEAEWLQAGGAPMKVDHHSDPCLVDWDGDGDLDLLSGSMRGGASLFANVGSKAQPEFAALQTLVEPHALHATVMSGTGDAAQETPESILARFRFGDADLAGPSACTRVWADDIDGDGILDLLIGDIVTLQFTLDGRSDAETRQALVVWEKKLEEISRRMQPGANGRLDAAVEEEWRKHDQAKAALVREEQTGFVWFFKGKAKGAGAKRTASN